VIFEGIVTSEGLLPLPETATHLKEFVNDKVGVQRPASLISCSEF